MNNTYKLVWSNLHNSWIVVSELAKGKKKKSSKVTGVISVASLMVTFGQGIYAAKVELGGGSASTDTSVAIGTGAKATQTSAIALGTNSSASSIESIAIGNNVTTSGRYAVGIGGGLNQQGSLLLHWVQRQMQHMKQQLQ